MKKILCLTAVLFSSYVLAQTKPVIAVHGGAGTILPKNLSSEKEREIRQTLEKAASEGYALLKRGETSLAAVTQAIVILENSPLFNAGIGAVYNYAGEHELDASIMDGKTLNAGAVSGLKQIKHPILLAKDVMHNSVHVMLTGTGAEAFAKTLGYKLVDNSLFNTEFRYNSWQKAKEALKQQPRASLYLDNPALAYGTVGAVALDQQGNLAAGTSTGGMTVKRWGRVGDSPIIGAGTYANNQSCAVSATGHGEYFIRFNVAADICARVKYKGLSVSAAADQVINQDLLAAGGTGGVIVAGNKGELALTFNTPGMYRAAVDSNGEVQVAIYKDK